MFRYFFTFLLFLSLTSVHATTVLETHGNIQNALVTIVFIEESSSFDENKSENTFLWDKLLETTKIRDDFLLVKGKDDNYIPSLVKSFMTHTQNDVMDLISTQKNPCLVFIKSGKPESVKLVPGTKGFTSSGWIVNYFITGIQKNNYTLDLDQNLIPLYRIGWGDQEENIAPFLEQKIPCILLETSVDISPLLFDLIQLLNENPYPEDDKHYLILKFLDTWYVLSEFLLVTGVIALSAIILFFIFIFGFIFTQKGEKRLQEIAAFSWIPIIYLIITSVCLFFGQKLVEAIFLFRFKDPFSTVFLPLPALIAKFAFSLFFITLIDSFNQLIRFPKESFLYGYLASIVGFVNIFIFSSIDFSLSITFLFFYAILFIAYHVKGVIPQLLLMGVSIIPFLPYGFALKTLTYETLEPLIHASTRVNVLAACLLLPFQLVFLRILHSFKQYGRQHKNFLPMMLPISFVLFSFSFGFLLLKSPLNENNKQSVLIREKLSDEGVSLSLESSKALLDIKPYLETEKEKINVLRVKPEQYLMVSINSQFFLDRRIVTITLGTPLTPIFFEASITSSNSIAVYDSMQSFELLDGGTKAVFKTTLNPLAVQEFYFSASDDPKLQASITLWTMDNPHAITIPLGWVESSCIFEVERNLFIPLNGHVGDSI